MKKIPEDYSFWVRTFDGTARAGEDYEPKNELMTMHADHTSRDIEIVIHDDPNWEPDEEFKVELWHATEQKRIEGEDTQCVVLIQDEDKPGSIGFEVGHMEVRRRDKSVYVHLVRTNGQDGEISCTLNTYNDIERIPGKQAAKEGVDFMPIVDRKIIFKSNEMDMWVEIEMPMCEAPEDIDPEELDTVSFALELSHPLPNGTKLSKRANCFINIEPDDEDTAAA